MNKNIFNKVELQSLAATCERLKGTIINSVTPAKVTFGDIEKVVNALMSYECFFAYLYAEVCHYGKATDLLSTKDEVYGKYTLSASLVFSEPAMDKYINRLPTSWKAVADFILKIPRYNEDETTITLSDEVNVLSMAFAKIGETKTP